MSPTDEPDPDDPVLRPRTVAPARSRGPVLRPRTVPALGRPVPVPPPLEAFVDPTWQPSGQVPAVAVDEDQWTFGPTDDQRSPTPGPRAAGEVADIGTGSGPLAGTGIGISSDAVVVEGPDGEAAVPAVTTAAPPTPGPSGMLRSNLAVASGTAVSRLTGLVRTSLILILLGKGLNDAYVNANNTPNMIYELILGGVLTATLVPLFTDDLEHEGKGDATSAIISFALVALVAVTVLATIVAPLLILLLSTGSAASSRHDYITVGVPLALLFAPQVFFYGLMAVWSAALNARHRFLAAAWAPVLNNVIAIATLLTAGSLVAGNPTLNDAIEHHSLLWVLGLGTTAGIAVMALALYPSIRRAGVRLHFHVDLKHPAVRRAVRLSGWTFGYVVANQVAVVVIQILAKPSSGDPTRYQTAFQYFQLPHGLLAVSIMVTFEPLLGRASARGDRTAFNEHLLLGFRLIGLLIIPAAVGYVALPKGLDHRTFVASGELGKALGLTGIIAAFAIGLPGFSTYLYALRGFYAMKNTKIPFLVNLLENAINIAAAVVLVQIWGVVGLALAFALAYSVAAVVAVAVLCRYSPGFDWRGLAATWAKLLAAALMMAGFVYLVVRLIAPSSPVMILPALAAGILVGAVTYGVAIFALRVPGITELLARLPGLRRFAR